jgi:hypothetical protein
MVSIATPIIAERRHDIADDDRAAHAVKTLQCRFASIFISVWHDTRYGLAMRRDDYFGTTLHLSQIVGQMLAKLGDVDGIHARLHVHNYVQFTPKILIALLLGNTWARDVLHIDNSYQHYGFQESPQHSMTLMLRLIQPTT